MLPILYQDEYLVVIHKPAGLLVHRTGLDRHETRFAVQLLRDQIGQRVWPVHRLDRGTSGILVFAFSAELASQVGRQFADASVEKHYLAVVRGHPPESGIIDYPLVRHYDPYEFVGDGTSAEPQAAITAYRRLATVDLPFPVDRYPSSRYALVELTPHTGRRHQIRRHLKHIAHPIVGDATYGKGRHNRFFAEKFGCRRLLLACTELRLQHPFSGCQLALIAQPAEDFTELLQQLGWAQ